jgi:putative ABC transport system permease protein
VDLETPATGRPTAWLESIAERLQAFPAVGAVGAARTIPLDRDWDRGAYYIAVPGEPYDPERQQTAAVRTVSPTFFDAVGARILAGRTFQSGDGAAVIVNEAFVRRYLPDREPMGESFYWGFPVVSFLQPLPIIGVIEDIRYESLAEPGEPTFYNVGVSSRLSVVVETNLDDPARFIPELRAAVSEVDPSVSFSVTPLADVVAPELARQRTGLALMSLFGIVSLILAAIGIHGAIAQLTEGRAAELATRMALGASPASVRWLVLSQGRDIALAGAMLGLTLTYLGGRAATAQLYEVQVLDPSALGTAVAAVLLVAALSFVANARMAAKREPVQGLRRE